MCAQRDDRLTSAEISADNKANYDEALRAMRHGPPRPEKQILVGRKLPNVRPELVGSTPDRPAMFRAAPAPNRLGLGVPESERLVPRNASPTAGA
jgi:hypothetical protein